MTKNASKMAPTCVRFLSSRRGSVAEAPANFHSYMTKMTTSTAKATNSPTTSPDCQALCTTRQRRKTKKKNVSTHYLTPPHWSARRRQLMRPSMITDPVQSKMASLNPMLVGAGFHIPRVHLAILRSV